MRSILRLLLSKNPLRQMAATDRKVLAICMGAAFVFWLILNLSREYTVNETVAVEYVLAPERVLQNANSRRSVDVTLTGSGWNLLLENLRRNPPVAEVEVGDADEVRLSEMDFKRQIVRKLSSGKLDVDLPGFQSEIVKTDVKEGKRVPLINRTRINYAPGHRPTTSVRLIPDSITVSGSVEDLAGIESWPTETVMLDGIDDDVERLVRLAPAPRDTLVLSRQQVILVVEVEAFIEERFTVAITLRGGQAGATYEFSPQLADLTVNLPQSAYGRYDNDDFSLVADLSDFAGNGSDNVVPVVLERAPEGLAAVRYAPKVVSCYLVE